MSFSDLTPSGAPEGPTAVPIATDGAIDEPTDVAAGTAAEAAATEIDDATDVVTDDTEPAPDEPDPAAEYRENLRKQPGEWYVIHSYAGYEKRVKTNLESRIVSMHMEDYIFAVEVP